MNYISLFSCAGIGCYGFKLENFKCLATVEIDKKRIAIQKYNNKCISDVGYINKDITQKETKECLDKAIKTNLSIINESKIDVIIATPPCQGMSSLNTKKTINDIIRNSLVLDAILTIEKYQPCIFILENVKEFLKADCTDIDNKIKKINNIIDEHLNSNYLIEKKIINFKEYGSNSSRTRTLIIGVKKELNINPNDLFPQKQEIKTLFQTIGHLKSLNYGEIDTQNILHFSKKLNERHLKWIHSLKEGESAFNNSNLDLRPHKFDKDGNRIEFNNNMNGKFTRQKFNECAKCVHTYTNNPNSQFTLHPKDNRVFSILELMLMQGMNIDFKWDNKTYKELNNLSLDEKTKWIKKHERTIRTVIGESVPTIIFQQIAQKINYILNDF